MAAILELPFEIGETRWQADAGPRAVEVPCPVCAGKRAVVVILGDGEHVSVPCDACGLGFSGPQGHVQEYEHTPRAKPFTIARVWSMQHDKDYVVEDELGFTMNLSYLYATEAEALAEAERRAEEHQSEQYDRRQRKRRTDGSRYAWTVRYHRERIAECERQLAWHRSKVQSVKAK